MELHHLKETHGKLWNWKINNNNEIHMLHQFWSLQSSTHVAWCKHYFLVFSYNAQSSAGFCFTSSTPKSQHYSWHCTRIQGSSACIIRKYIFQFIQSCNHRIWNNAKSSAGFRTSAMFKTSTTLGFIWDNNTCIVQPPIIKYSSCISCYLVWDSPKRKQSTSLTKRNGAPPPKENTMQGYERLTKIRKWKINKD